ncbi:FAD-dependent monooxygenase [Janthinobacterium sp. SUN073]|uniref:FAD-dependent monooxygenase n=1 Tax=Janthinobacterium sp. SUN073 TaxID=3004102 RepID=UPI0025B1FE89|nr:FAD-dependent monooxygenase [Janthinobacterium sp. SUN073]MDN2697874.1 FAD-dependent monooxygenase [Janthinobacterium sp. SUN073]
MISTQTDSHRARGGETAPVAIVGAGTAGSVLALLLAQYGIRSVLVERGTQADPHPRGNVWSIRSMEVLRSIAPDLADDFREASAPPLKLRYITWCTSLAGVDLGRCVPLGDPGHTAALLACSPCRPLHLSQNVADPILRAQVLAQPLIELLPGHALVALSQDAQAATLTLLHCASGTTSRRAARYVIGADGAASATREALGIASATTPLQAVAQIHFRANLAHLTSARPSPLYWILNADVAGALSAHTADDSEWVLSCAVLPPQLTAADIGDAQALAMVRAAIGDAGVPVELMSVRPWSMELRRAATLRRGRALLIGDAAAGFSAIGGFGMNHGIQDAASLAWRLALLLRAGDAAALRDVLLDSYVRERQQSIDDHARRTRELSGLSDQVMGAAGLDPAGLGKLAALSASAPVRLLPRALARKLVGGLLAGGLKPLARLAEVSDDGAALRARVRRAIDRQREVFVTLGMDLGHALSCGFVCREPHPHPRSPNEHTEYWPTTSPGGLIPHAWSGQRGSDLSTRDLARQHPLTLLVQASQRAAWLAALDAVNAQWGIRIACPCIDDSDAAQFRLAAPAFAQALEMEPDGALLVRGDGVVVWRSRRRCAAPAQTLADVFATLFSHNNYQS